MYAVSGSLPFVSNWGNVYQNPAGNLLQLPPSVMCPSISSVEYINGVTAKRDQQSSDYLKRVVYTWIYVYLYGTASVV
jgi:hypothetical protein